MYYTRNKWFVYDCDKIGSPAGYLISNSTSKQCVHSTKAGWTYGSGSTLDPTAKVTCDVGNIH